MRICVKDLSGSGPIHDPLTVAYAVVGGTFLTYALWESSALVGWIEIPLNSTLLKYPPLSFFNIDMDPCLNVQCPRFGVCKAYNAFVGHCECNDQCPSYQDQVCSASGTTYDNQCWQKLGNCKGLESDPRIYHPGSCEGKQHRKLPLLSRFRSPWI